MRSLFTEHKILAGAILLLFIFSLLCQIVTGFLYQNMIKETYNMSSTENKMLKVCKLKFTNRYELHERVVNIPVFVDKFIHSIKFGPLPAKSLQHLSGQLLLLTVFMTGAGACRAIIMEKTIGEILSYYVVAFVMLYAYFAVSAAVDIKGKKEVLKINLIDYLENNISVRIPQSKKEQERLDELEAKEEGKHTGRQADALREMAKKEGQGPAEIADFASRKRKEEEKKLAPEEVKELEGLLLDFVYHSC
ncbi:MAG: hypothetical protein HDR27_01475 [Lachnospiraceae bacterium]|nr:hypothetical protein [Lachnospiraceae bacterium]